MKVLIIPNSKIINKDLQDKFGKIPSLLVPLNGKVIIDTLYEKYKDNYEEIIIVAKEKNEILEEYISYKKINVTVLKLDSIKDLGYSIVFALQYLKEHFEGIDIENISVNLGDTIVEDIILNEHDDMVAYGKVEDSERWTTFELKNDKLTNLYDKTERDDGVYNAFTGIYSFSNFNFLYNILKNEIEIIDSKIDSFYRTLIKYNNEYNLKFVETKEWLDVGHLDKYNESKREVEARFFNTISIDKKRGILSKKSTDKEKFKNEILWYLRLPSQLQYVIPQIFDYSLQYDNMYINMEYYGYNTLNELFVFGNLSNNQWNKILSSIFFTIEDMKKYKVDLSRDEVINSLGEMYISKTLNRLRDLEKNDSFKEFFRSDIIINSHKYKNLNYYIDLLPKIMEKYNVYDIDNFSIIHGDLCFSNILYDSNSSFIRLIDPRGQFGGYDIYGDTRYDIAKLSHSIMGNYDFIINDLFNLDFNNTVINYTIKDGNGTLGVKKLFLRFLEEYKYDINQIRFIESLLFLSMIPLHNDKPQRQYIMLATGLQILNELI